MKKIFTLILFAALATIKANAQDGSSAISQLFKGSPDDVNKLVNAYANPLFKGFGNSLNGGWTNTGKTLGTLHFTLRITASGSIVPNSDKTFDASKIGLSSRFSFPNGSIAPTFGGSTTTGPAIKYTDPTPVTGGSVTTNLPSGVSSIVPAPQVQLTVGLPKNTDFTLRLIPTIKISDNVGSVGMFGFGLKHNIAQDFSSITHPIPFDLAVAVGYTHLNYNLPLDVRKDDGVAIPGQTLQGHFSGWNAQAILSKKLLFFTPFVSVGYLSSTTDVGMKGNFPFVTGATITGKPTYTTYADPISINGSASETSGARADVGFQLNLAFFKIYASYSFAEYQSFNGGIGFGF
jgi:hypothetical protein